MKIEAVLICLALVAAGGGLGYALGALTARGWLWALWIGCALGVGLCWAISQAAPGLDGLGWLFLSACFAIMGAAAVVGGGIGRWARRRRAA